MTQLSMTIEKNGIKLILIAILSAVLLFALANINLQYKTKPVTIPQAIELQWSADSTWTKRGWE